MGQEEGIQVLPDKILLKIFSYLPHKVFSYLPQKVFSYLSHKVFSYLPRHSATISHNLFSYPHIRYSATSHINY
jgi:hypothetical protein